MEQRMFIKLAFEDDFSADETHRNLIARYGHQALSYSTVTYWRREFQRGRENVSTRRDPADLRILQWPHEFKLN
jgi:hypothetical protein